VSAPCAKHDLMARKVLGNATQHVITEIYKRLGLGGALGSVGRLNGSMSCRFKGQLQSVLIV